MAKKENKMMYIPQHLLLNVLAKRAGKKKALQEIWAVRVGRQGPGDRREGHVRRRGPREDDRAVRARARGEARPGRIARVAVSKDYLHE